MPHKAGRLATKKRRSELVSYLLERAKTESDINEHLLFLYKMVLKTNAQKIVELGTRDGNSTCALVIGAAQTGGHVVSVDYGKGAEYSGEAPTWDSLAETSALIKSKLGLGSFWSLVVKDDIDFAREYQDEVDLLFIDTSHSYEQTKRELEAWGTKVVNRGTILIHDTVSFPEQNKAIWEFLDRYPSSDFVEHKNCNGLAIITKKTTALTKTKIRRSKRELSSGLWRDRVNRMQEALIDMRNRLREKDNDLIARLKQERVKLESDLLQRLKDPLGKLLLIYNARPDIQSSFPEVDKGDYSRLLDWAMEQAVSGKDAAHQLLASHAPWYETNPWHRLSELEEELDGMRTELSLRKSSVLGLEAERSRLSEESYRMRTEFSRRESDAKALEAERSKLSEELDRTRTELSRRESDAKALEAERSRLSEELYRMRTEFSRRQSDAKALEAERSRLSGELDRTRTELSRRESDAKALEAERSRLSEELDRTKTELASRDSSLLKLQEEKGTAQSELSAIKRSFGYKFMRSYASRIDRLFPDGTSRGEMRKVATECARIQTEEGSGNLLRKSLEKIKRREFRLVEPTRRTTMKEVTKTPSISSTELSRRESDAKALEAERSKLSEELDRTRTELSRRESDAKALEAERSRLSEELDRTKMELSRRESDAKALEAERSRLSEELDRTKMELSRRESDAKALEAERYKLSEELEFNDALKHELTKLYDHLEYLDYLEFLSNQDVLEFPSDMIPRVSVIVVTYNKAHYAYKCLLSLLNSNPPPFELIVVDNASSDQTSSLLRRVRNAKVIVNTSNQFFARANNQGASAAKGEYLLFLNQDAFVHKDCVASLMKTLDSSLSIGAVGAKLVSREGELLEAGSIVWGDGSCLGYGRGDNPDKPEYCYVRDVDYSSAACLMVRREAFFSVGEFDEDFIPAYYEDTDLCMKLWDKGFRVVYQPMAAATHVEFSSSSFESASRLMQKQRLKFLAKHSQALEGRARPSENGLMRARDRKSRPTILIIDDCVPKPSEGSGYPRMFLMLKSIASLGYRVTLLPLNDATPKQPETDILTQMGVEVLWGATGAQQLLESRRDSYDMVLISRPHNAFLAMNLVKETNPKARVIYDAEALWYRREQLRQSLGYVSADPRFETEEAEFSLIRSADYVIAVSEVERKLIQEKFGDSERVVLLGHPHAVAPTLARFEERHDLLFLAGFRSASSAPGPNDDAAIHFAKEVLPRIQEEIPGLKFIIAGSNPPESVKLLASDSILVIDYVKDLRQLYEGSRVFVAPVRFAAGALWKVTEAMSYGIPCVLSTAAAQGMEIRDGEEALIARDEEDFVEKTVRLYQDKALWTHIREQGLEYVAKNCDPSQIEERLDAFLRKISQSPM